jgi:hypothetical protein
VPQKHVCSPESHIGDTRTKLSLPSTSSVPLLIFRVTIDKKFGLVSAESIREMVKQDQ